MGGSRITPKFLESNTQRNIGKEGDKLPWYEDFPAVPCLASGPLAGWSKPSWHDKLLNADGALSVIQLEHPEAGGGLPIEKVLEFDDFKLLLQVIQKLEEEGSLDH